MREKKEHFKNNLENSKHLLLMVKLFPIEIIPLSEPKKYSSRGKQGTVGNT